ncbi:MAG TPA: hydrogenase formation protein HypD [bacterium]|nr:hydrogenase formation protein HypD [bacterium]
MKKAVNLMEVCGTHTMAISRYGLRGLLPENIKLISGPGCPVCVSPNSFIDKAIAISKIPGMRIATFGDMYRVPSAMSSLEKEHGCGASIDIVYSPLDALEIARSHSNEKVVFLGVGFETTAPLVANVIKYAKMSRINNFMVLAGNKLIPPAMEMLVRGTRHSIDGFICPGHVSIVIGAKPYEIFPKNYGIPCVISGFEPCDILQSILLLLEMISGKQRNEVKIQYSRCVAKKGNLTARKIMNEAFDVVDSEWRGIGIIPSSGLSIKEQFKEYDAECVLNLDVKISRDKKGCLCGDVLKGLKTPQDCVFFAKKCTPQHPVGPCMVSSEGTCAAYYAYERR